MMLGTDKKDVGKCYITPFGFTVAILLVLIIIFQFLLVHFVLTITETPVVFISLIILLIPLATREFIKVFYKYLVYFNPEHVVDGDEIRIDLLSVLSMVSTYLYYLLVVSASYNFVSAFIFSIIGIAVIGIFVIIMLIDRHNKKKKDTSPSS